MRIAVVINPTKVVDVELSRELIVEALAAAAQPGPLWYETTADDPGHGQTRQAIAAGAEVVIAYGGDGTVRACAHELAGSGVALAVIPGGTGNLLVANLQLPTTVKDVVACVVGDGRRQIDLGRVDGTHFAVMAGLGFDAAMIEATPERWKRIFGWPAYVFGGLSRLLDRPMQVRMSLDGRMTFVGSARTVLVANVGKLQGGLDLFGDASPDDGLFDIAVVRPRGLGEWITLASAVLVRRRPHRRHLETFRASTVNIRTRGVVARQLDGDTIEPGNHLEVTIDRAALTICVPG